jgi:hypothetical protein
MADTPRTPVLYDSDKDGTGISNVEMWAWAGLDGDDTGIPVKFAKYSDKTAHIYSPTAAYGSATVTIEGSNDPRANPAHASHASALWVTLTDAQGNAISKTSDAIETILENPLWIRPKTAGGTSSDVTVAIVGRR